MLIELRRLVATDDEFAEIAASYVASRADGFKDQLSQEFTCHNVSIVAEDPLELRVNLQMDSGIQCSECLDAHDAMSAFIARCQETGIPICKASQKKISKIEGGIAMDMTLQG